MPFTVEVEDIVPVLRPGLYPATFMDITEETNDNGTFWLWKFMAEDGAMDVDITATTSPRITPRTKAAKFLAGLGVTVDVGQSVDFEKLVGTRVQILVSVNDAGFSRIDNIVPITNEAPKPKGK